MKKSTIKTSTNSKYTQVLLRDTGKVLKVKTSLKAGVTCYKASPKLF